MDDADKTTSTSVPSAESAREIAREAQRSDAEEWRRQMGRYAETYEPSDMRYIAEINASAQRLVQSIHDDISNTAKRGHMETEFRLGELPTHLFPGHYTTTQDTLNYGKVKTLNWNVNLPLPEGLLEVAKDLGMLVSQLKGSGYEVQVRVRSTHGERFPKAIVKLRISWS
jgi:hypothetical protein